MSCLYSCLLRQKRGSREKFAHSPWLMERGRGGGCKEKERITRSSRNKGAVWWHVKSCSETLAWTMDSVGSSGGILWVPMVWEQCPRCFPKGVWFQDQLEQIWARTTVERGSPVLPTHLCLGLCASSRLTPGERVGACLGATTLSSSRVAANQLELIAKPHSEIATKPGIYLARLHAAFDNTSTVGFCASLGFFFFLDGMTFFLCGGLFSYAATKEEDGTLTKVIVKCLLLPGCLEIHVELRIIQLC